MAAELSRRQWLTLVAGAGSALSLPAIGWAQPAQRSVQRLITVGGAVTEVVYALGAQSLLVATDTTSLYPEAATRTPKVGYLRQLSAEGLLSLRPDAIVGAAEAGPAIVLEQVKAAGVRVELIPADHSFAEVLRKVQTVGHITGREVQAQALAKQLKTQWAQVESTVAQAQRKPKALFILSHSGAPMVAGRGTAAHALLTLAGAQNVVQQFEGYRPLTAEAMAAAAPDVLVNSTQGIEALGGVDAFWRRPELALTPAFARKALVMMEASQLLGFGPRLPEAVSQLHSQMLKATA
ncbi:MAG: ABC transporter substrate-binding protein [Comamonas sp.]|uniref:heme/hemin ABC transporter substrate-binding protein n=1 Tax=Comamonas sp. TaxID=34028 RepID=UPI002FCC17BD